MSGAEERLARDPTSELWGEHRARYRFAAQFISGTVLDLACGSGFGLEMLASAGTSVVGVDYDAAPLRQLRHRRLVRADATRVPFGASTFDAVVSFETIEHVANPAAMVAELRRVLKPGGSLVLSTPNRAFGPAERHTRNEFHIREFTADELRDILKGSFDVVRLFGQVPSTAYRYVPFLMVRPDFSPRALVWKVLARLPFPIKNAIAQALGGRPFYPGEADYCFELGAAPEAHALVAVAR